MDYAQLFSAEGRARRVLNAGHNFINSGLVGDFLENYRPGAGLEAQFLVSFPRSGNGYVRFLMTKIILAAAGYDVDRATIDAYVHNPVNGNRAQRFNFPDRDEAVSVEAVIPDIHMNTPEAVAALGERFSINGVRLIKTHNLVPEGAARYLYLFREPKAACTSYFQLNTGPEFVAEKRADAGFTAFFNEAVSNYIDIYVAMGEAALRDIDRSRAAPLALTRLEAGDASDLVAWFASAGSTIGANLIADMAQKNKKKSGFNAELLGLWDSSSLDRLKRAQDVYARLAERRAPD